MGQDLFWPGYKRCRHLGFLCQEDPGESVPNGSKKIKWRSMRAQLISTPPVRCSHIDGVRIVLHSLRAPFKFYGETSGRFMMTL